MCCKLFISIFDHSVTDIFANFGGNSVIDFVKETRFICRVFQLVAKYPLVKISSLRLLFHMAYFMLMCLQETARLLCLHIPRSCMLRSASAGFSILHWQHFLSHMWWTLRISRQPLKSTANHPDPDVYYYYYYYYKFLKWPK